MEGWKRVLRLQGSSRGPFVQVDEAAVTGSWMDGGKKMVRLLDGQVFEVAQTVDIPAPPAVGGKIKFMSSDGVEFEMDRVAARKSLTIMLLVKTSRTGSIPIVEVKSKILEKVLDYCYTHVPRAAAAAAAAANTEASAEELKSWDADFVKVDLDTLYHLVMAARYLEIYGLEDLAYRAVADIIGGKTPEEIRATFYIKKDMTPEEEEVAVRELHAWRQRATSSSANMVLTPEEAAREWMDIVNSKFCTYYMLEF